MAKRHTDHDKLFKMALSDIPTAKEFLKTFLPKEIRKLIDFSQLELDNTSYITRELKQFLSDVVLKAAFIKSGTALIVLLEHKSKISHDIYIQLIEYIIRILKKNRKKNDT